MLENLSVLTHMCLLYLLDILSTTAQEVEMFSGQTSLMVRFNLLPSAFLRVGDTFMVTLTGYGLKTGQIFINHLSN